MCKHVETSATSRDLADALATPTSPHGVGPPRAFSSTASWRRARTTGYKSQPCIGAAGGVRGGCRVARLPAGCGQVCRHARAVFRCELPPCRGGRGGARARLGALGVGALGVGAGRAAWRGPRGRGEAREGPVVSARPSIERVLLSRVRRKRYLRAQPPALKVPRLRRRCGVQAQPDPVPVHGVRRGEHMRAQTHALPVQGLRRELYLRA